MKIGIGVDIGGTHISCSAIDLKSGQPIKGTQFDQDVNNKGNKEQIFEAWAKPINQVIACVDGNEIQGIGFGIPGSFNYKKGIALYERNDKYEQLHNVDVKNEFAKYIEAENVQLRFMNDASAFGVGTAWLGKAKGYKKSISITLGTGFGSSFVDDFIPLSDDPSVPPHGSFWQLPFKESIADDYFSTRWFVNSYQSRAMVTEQGVKQIAAKASKDPIARSLFYEFGSNLAEFLVPWFEKFQPEIFVIGGNVSKAWPLIEVAFQKQINRSNLNFKTVTSDLMEDAAWSGSAKLLDDDYYHRIECQLPEV